jgi:hypothetical protein
MLTNIVSSVRAVKGTLSRVFERDQHACVRLSEFNQYPNNPLSRTL